MDSGTLIIILAIATLGAVLLFAFTSKKKAEKQYKKNETAEEKSTLAADAPSTRHD